MSYTNELQIQIDDVYACLGRCPGCMLSASERKTMIPDMSPDTMDMTIDALKKYVSTLPRLGRFSLAFGVADHFLLDDDYICSLYEKGASLIEHANPKELHECGVTFSTSLVGKPEKVLQRMRSIKARIGERKVAFIPVVVLDPMLLKKDRFGEKYRDLILESRALFGQVDLSINISHETVTKFTPAEIHDFAADNGFDELTVNWLPTDDNLNRTVVDIPRMSDWLIEFYSRLRSVGKVHSSFGQIMETGIQSVRHMESGKSWTMSDSIAAFLPERMAYSLHIDHQGNVAPKMEAVGDIPHLDRFGFQPIGNVREKDISVMIAENIKTVGRRIARSHFAFSQCVSCEYLPICAGTGFHVVNNVLKISNESYRVETLECPTVSKALIRYFEQDVLV